MNSQEARTLPLVPILETIGSKPVRHRKGEAVYFSPLRTERTPSFHVNEAKNAWYDFGEGAGGNTLDFACAYLASQGEADTVHDALRWLSNMTGKACPISYQAPSASLVKEPSLTVKRTSPVKHRALTSYLAKRGIPLAVASAHLIELHLYNSDSGKYFFSLGMRNEEDGYELRNPFFKGCAGTKAITFVRGTEAKPQAIHLFEGMFDFLSVLAQKNFRQFAEDAIILHSLSCLKQAAPYIAGYGYRTAFTWLDNDTAGAKATLALKTLFKAEMSLQHHPMNNLYLPHKDVNAWHTSNLSP